MKGEQIKKLQDQNYTLRKYIALKDDEIERQIAKRKLAEQVRNWTIILTVLIHLAIWLF